MTYNNFSQIEMHLSMDADKTFLELTKKLQCTIVVVSHKKTKVFTLDMKDERQILHKHVLYHTGTETICLLEEAKLFNYIRSQNNFVSVIGETGKAFPEIVKTIEKGKPSVTPLITKKSDEFERLACGFFRRVGREYTTIHMLFVGLRIFTAKPVSKKPNIV